MVDGQQFFGTNLLGGGVTVLHEGLMIRSCQGLVSFTNAFFINSKPVNLKDFDNSEKIYT